MDEQIKELTKHVMDLRLDLARVDTKMDAIKDMQHKVEDHGARLVAVENSAASAHHRLNGVGKIVYSIGVGTALAVVGAVVTFVVKGGLMK